MNYYETQNIGGLQGMTSTVRFLLILNIFIYLGERFIISFFTFLRIACGLVGNFSVWTTFYIYVYPCEF